MTTHETAASPETAPRPKVVSDAEWRAAHEAQLVRRRHDEYPN